MFYGDRGDSILEAVRIKELLQNAIPATDAVLQNNKVIYSYSDGAVTFRVTVTVEQLEAQRDQDMSGAAGDGVLGSAT